MAITWEINTAVATPKIPQFIEIIRSVVNNIVKTRFHLRSMLALSTDRSSIEAALENGRGRADRQTRINIGIADTHFCQKIIGI